MDHCGHGSHRPPLPLARLSVWRDVIQGFRRAPLSGPDFGFRVGGVERRRLLRPAHVPRASTIRPDFRPASATAYLSPSDVDGRAASSASCRT
jgi:hypothetical protein